MAPKEAPDGRISMSVQSIMASSPLTTSFDGQDRGQTTAAIPSSTLSSASAISSPAVLGPTDAITQRKRPLPEESSGLEAPDSPRRKRLLSDSGLDATEAQSHLIREREGWETRVLPENRVDADAFRPPPSDLPRRTRHSLEMRQESSAFQSLNLLASNSSDRRDSVNTASPPDSSQGQQPLDSRAKRPLPEGRPSPGVHISQAPPPPPPPARRQPDIRSPSAGQSPSPSPAAVSGSSSQAAGNRRRHNKVSRACDFCKSKKLKCSGTIPCDVCTKKHLSCIYDATYRRGRPPTPPPAQGYRQDATKATSRRVGSPPAAPRSPVALMSPALDSVPKKVVQPRNADLSPPSGRRGRREESAQPASRASPEAEMAEIEGQYFDTTSNLTFLQRAWKRLFSHGDAASQVPSGGDQHQKMTRAGDKPFASQPSDAHPLRERSVGLEMLRFYFDVCVVTYRCLHQGCVADWFNSLLTNAEDNLELNTGIGHAKASIVMTVLSIVTLRQTKVEDSNPSGLDEGLDLRRSDHYFCLATKLTDQETGLPKLESAQARLLQVLYLLQTSRMNQAWYVFGSVLPIVSALGLHRTSGRKKTSGGTGPQSDYIISQCRKRTFWVAYTIDKYLSAVLGRPRMYHDEDIDQEFPDCVNDEDMTPQGRSSDEPEMDCHIESLVYHAKLSQLIAGISRDVYSIKPIPRAERLVAAHRYGRALRSWRESLPHHLGTVRPMSLIPSFRRQNTALKLAYCHAIMHANRPFLLGATATENAGQPTALGDSVEECINAARSALETVDGMASDGTLFHAFWWTPYVTFCALAVVYVWRIQRGRDATDKSLFELADRCQSHLAKATASDSPSRRYSVVLEELRDEAIGQRNRPSTSADYGQLSEQPLVSGQDAQPEQRDEPFREAVAPQANMSEMFSAQEFDGMTKLFSEWQTTDWLDLDASVYRTREAF